LYVSVHIQLWSGAKQFLNDPLHIHLCFCFDALHTVDGCVSHTHGCKVSSCAKQLPLVYLFEWYVVVVLIHLQLWLSPV